MSLPHLNTRAFRVAVATLVCLVAMPTSVSATPSDSKSLGELKSEREAVRKKKASAAGDVDTLRATDAELTAALSALNENVSGQAALVEEARRAQKQAEDDEKAALEAEKKAADELATLEGEIKTKAVNAYVNSDPDELLELLSADSLTDANNKRAILEVTTNSNLDTEEQFRSIQQDLESARTRAEEASERADAKRSEVEDELEKLKTAQKEQESFLADVEDRLDHALAEAQSLASLDSALSNKISGEQNRLAREVAAQRAAAAARAQAAGGSRSASAPSSGAVVSLPSSGGNGIVSVGGIRVDSSISGNLSAMINAARADGVHLAGGGYRDPAGQIAVRRSNCGSSSYAIYQMPSSSCSPPTARPGSSMHERGLAIDFTEGGRTLNRSSAGYHWLRAHAAGYGFYNLPSEAWHWSTTGG